MGQYHVIVNLDKREFIHPHKLGCGLKQWEQISTTPGTCQALFVLLCCSNGRGGGDLPDGLDYKFNPGGKSEYVENATRPLAKAVLGRWAGDRVAVVGDYTENSDMPNVPKASEIYDLCRDAEEANRARLEGETVPGPEVRYTDISRDVRAYFHAIGEPMHKPWGEHADLLPETTAV